MCGVILCLFQVLCRAAMRVGAQGAYFFAYLGAALWINVARDVHRSAAARCNTPDGGEIFTDISFYRLHL